MSAYGNNEELNQLGFQSSKQEKTYLQFVSRLISILADEILHYLKNN